MIRNKKIYFSLLSVFVFFFTATAIAVEKVTAQVVDVGAGLCVPIKIESGGKTYHILYDAGAQLSEDNKNHCINAVNDFLGKNNTIIDRMIISHADADHIYDADEILAEYRVIEVIRNGKEKDTDAWRNLNEAIKESRSITDTSACESNTNNKFQLGTAKITIIPPEECGIDSEHSIMAKIELGDYSLILTGDAEKTTIKSAIDRGFDLKASVILAPHPISHDPADVAVFTGTNKIENRHKYVIFSAGRKYSYPRREIVKEYLLQNIPVKNIFRTDLGEVSEGDDEWAWCTKSYDEDKPANNSIEIEWTDSDGSLAVNYINKDSQGIYKECISWEGSPFVIDGDTLGVVNADVFGTIGAIERKIRLFGIDSPEFGQYCSDEKGEKYECGKRTIEALEKKIGNNVIRCEIESIDAYRRPLAVCSLGDTNLNKWLIEQGYAEAYREYSTDYVGYELIAQRDKKGIWKGLFISPQDWRRGVRYNDK